MTDLAAYLATPRPAARIWPAPDEPDWEKHDDRGDRDDRALWNVTPEYGDMLTKGGW